MKILNWNALNKEDFPFETCMTIGVFDGIHAGHKKLLEEVLSVSKEKNLSSGVVTFSDSIFSMFKNGEQPLQTLDERFSKLSHMGFDFCILIDFTPAIAKTDGLEFLRILLNKCRLSYIVEGDDFRLGDGGKTGKDEIYSFCLEKGIGVSFIPPVLYEGQRVSSTMIRKLLKEGDFSTAKKLLG